MSSSHNNMHANKGVIGTSMSTQHHQGIHNILDSNMNEVLAHSN